MPSIVAARGCTGRSDQRLVSGWSGRASRRSASTGTAPAAARPAATARPAAEARPRLAARLAVITGSLDWFVIPPCWPGWRRQSSAFRPPGPGHRTTPPLPPLLHDDAEGGQRRVG